MYYTRETCVLEFVNLARDAFMVEETELGQ